LHVHFLDPHRPGSSLIHRLDPRVKLTLALAFILTCALTSPTAWPVYILLFALILSMEVLSELGVGYVLKRAVLAFPFVLAAFPVIFTTPGVPWFEIPFFGWTLTISQAGVARFINIALKSWLSIQAAILLTASTPFPDLLMAMRAIHVPRLLVAIVGLMWRYLFVLVDEALRLLRARAARSGHTDFPSARPGGSLAWRAHIAGGMAGNLFLRAFERSDRIYVAMLARGYDGEVRATPLPVFGTKNRLILVAGLAALGILLLTAFLLG